MSITAMTMAMLLTGAGEVQRKPPPEAIPAPMLPPSPRMVPYPPAPPGYRPPLPSAAIRARANLNSYFSIDDYPARALHDREQGTVGVNLVIGPDGRIGGCTIADSSGSRALDEATCRILRSRARYTPARDSAGNPVSGRDYGRVTWRLPRPGDERAPPAAPPLRPPGTPGAYAYPVIAPPSVPPPPPPRPAPSPAERTPRSLQYYFGSDDYPAAALRTNAAGVTAVRLTIGPDGRVSDCVVTASSGSAPLDQATCRILRSRARYRPALDAAGNAVSGTDSGSITWRVPPD